MGLDRGPVVGADLDVDGNHAALAHRLEEAGVKDPRATVGDAGFDQDIRLHPIDHFLAHQHVFRDLDDRPAQPGEVVGKLGGPARLHPQVRDVLKRLVAVERNLLDRPVRVSDEERLAHGVGRHLPDLLHRRNHSIVLANPVSRL